MDSKILLLAISAAAFSSCSTAYKTGQTPDDVYYSPTRVYVENNQPDEKRKEDVYNYEDREIMMAIRNPRWRNFDYDYNYNPYVYGYNYGYYYNPYYCSYPVYNYNTFIFHYNNPVNITPRMTNLSGYGKTYNNVNVPYNVKTSVNNTPVRTYNNRNQSRPSQNKSTPDNNNTNSSDVNRTYSPSSSNSGSSSSSSSSNRISRPR